jgi:hypothetical protein
MIRSRVRSPNAVRQSSRDFAKRLSVSSKRRSANVSRHTKRRRSDSKKLKKLKSAVSERRRRPDSAKKRRRRRPKKRRRELLRRDSPDLRPNVPNVTKLPANKCNERKKPRPGERHGKEPVLSHSLDQEKRLLWKHAPSRKRAHAPLPVSPWPVNPVVAGVKEKRRDKPLQRLVKNQPRLTHHLLKKLLLLRRRLNLLGLVAVTCLLTFVKAAVHLLAQSTHQLAISPCATPLARPPTALLLAAAMFLRT